MISFRSTVVTGMLLGSLTLVATSCKKTSNTPPVTKFSEIKTSNTFDWKTTRKINFQVTGIPTLVNEKNLLMVSSADGKEVYFKNFMAMSQNLSTTVVIPRGVTNVLVSFGTIKKTMAVTGGTLDFNYTADLTD